jgi:catechol 2,3-dioxygenase-like lactoylglutathione lyase family enzyme
VPIEHFGLNVPDVDAAVEYFDEFLPMVGYVREWDSGYRPVDWSGAQLFLYPAPEDGTYSRLRTGLSHIAFVVATRAEVQRACDWVVARGDEVLHAPRQFPEYGETFYATHFLDPHGFHLEVVTFEVV